MSRTIRCKNMPKWYERGWTHDDDKAHAALHGGWKFHSWVDWKTKEPMSKWIFHEVSWGGRKSVPLEGKAYGRAWWHIHGDHHKNYWGNKKRFRDGWGAVRSKNRKNLNAWFRDPDTDVFFWEDVNTQDWD